MSKEGFDNETLIVNELNLKKFVNLSTNFKIFIQTLDSSVRNDSIIKARKLGGTCKRDIEVTVDEKVYGVSIKKGSGNSIHQEPVEEFIRYLKNELNVSYQVCNDILSFIWGDGTFTGVGNVADRISAKTFKNDNGSSMDEMQEFFDKNNEALIKRFLIEGSTKENVAEFIYYGDNKTGQLVPAPVALEYLSRNPLQSIPHVGGLSFQAWNRNINGGDKSETKRGQIQLKWGNLNRDIERIKNGK